MGTTLEMDIFEPIGEALIENGMSDYKSEIPFTLYICIVVLILTLCHK